MQPLGSYALEFCIAVTLCTLLVLWLVIQRCWLDHKRVTFVEAHDITVAHSCVTKGNDAWIVTRRGHFLALHADLRLALDLAAERLFNDDDTGPY